MGLKRWILSKILLYGAVFGFFYIIGDILNIIPQAVKDFVAEAVSFIKENIVLLSFVFCFSVGCWTVVKIATRGSKAKRAKANSIS